MASVFRAGTIFFSALVFAGCGGGGDTSPPIPDAPVGGIWSGTVDIEGQGVVELVGLVTEEGRGHFIQEDGVQYWGTVSASARNLTGTVSGAPPFGTTFPDGSVSATGTITGIIVPRATIEATSTFTTSDGTVTRGEVSLFFDSLYGRRSSFPAIAGNYTDASAPGSDSVSISSDGLLFGQVPATSCVLNGQIRLIAPSFNAYDIRFTYSNCAGELSALNGVAFGGIATLDNTSPPETLIAGLQGTASGVPVSVVLIYERT
jgi:hypothetical protein